MNNRGFLIEDSLVDVLIMIAICSMCAVLFRVSGQQYDQKELFEEENTTAYHEIFSKSYICQECFQEDPLP